ncbi:MAG TPA: adenylate/guanylate cyclase domain-containing protein, partial [Gammaproteobacteria bacterium]
VNAEPLPPKQFKGIAREVIPYAVRSAVAEERQEASASRIERQSPGMRLFVDPDGMDDAAVAQARSLLEDALQVLRARGGG